MNFSLLIGTVGALAGVGLGSWLSARAQRALFHENRRQSMRQSQLDACITFLEAYRKLTRFVLIEAQHVKLVIRKYDQQSHPQIEDQTPLFEERNAADARLTAVISNDSPIRMAADALNVAFRQLVHARAEHGHGGVPTEIVSGLRGAEDRFSQAVYEQLVFDQITGDAAHRRLAQRSSIRLGARRARTGEAINRSVL
jgi:hypothetical protein